MSGAEIYLDNNASTRPAPSVIETMVAALGDTANASSAHQAGERARALVEEARVWTAELVGASPEQVTFTSGGTESNSTVLLGLLRRWQARRLVTSTVEHASVLRAADALADAGFEVVALPVNRAGQIDIAQLEEALATPTDLVSIQWVNNETGVIQPIAQIAAICRAARVPFHTDAAQAAGKTPVSFDSLGGDFLTLTFHKFGGPQGCGAIVSRSPRGMQPLLAGGDQERGLRPGTENVAAIAGAGEAARLRMAAISEIVPALTDIRDTFEGHLTHLIPGIVINGSPSPRVCNTSNVLFGGVDGQALVARLDAIGVRCSQTSACHNQRPEPSHVLRAMGLSERDAYSSVRFSFADLLPRDVLWSVAAACSDLALDLRRLSAVHLERT